MFLITDYTLIVYSKTYRAKQLPDVERSNCPEKRDQISCSQLIFFLMSFTAKTKSFQAACWRWSGLAVWQWRSWGLPPAGHWWPGNCLHLQLLMKQLQLSTQIWSLLVSRSRHICSWDALQKYSTEVSVAKDWIFFLPVGNFRMLHPLPQRSW